MTNKNKLTIGIKEIAEILGVSYPTAQRRVKEIKSIKKIDEKKCPKHGYLWRKDFDDYFGINSFKD